VAEQGAARLRECWFA